MNTPPVFSLTHLSCFLFLIHGFLLLNLDNNLSKYHDDDESTQGMTWDCLIPYSLFGMISSSSYPPGKSEYVSELKKKRERDNEEMRKKQE